MPELACEACAATWTTGVDDLLRSDYWPATLHFATIYATDENGCTWTILSGIFKDARSANAALRPCEY